MRSTKLISQDEELNITTILTEEVKISNHYSIGLELTNY